MDIIVMDTNYSHFRLVHVSQQQRKIGYLVNMITLYNTVYELFISFPL